MVSSVLAFWRLETNRKAVFTCAEEVYDILVDISNFHYLLRKKLKRSSHGVFIGRDFSKTYELLA